jgi:hypothetical protein
MTQDLKFALTQLRRSPRFHLLAVATLALGIGAMTAIFSLVNGVLVRSLPFPKPDRLVALSTLEFPPGLPLGANAAAASYTDNSPTGSCEYKRRDSNPQLHFALPSLSSCNFRSSCLGPVR